MILSAHHKRRGTHPDGHYYRLEEKPSLHPTLSLLLTSATSSTTLSNVSNNMVTALFVVANSMQCCFAASLSIITL